MKQGVKVTYVEKNGHSHVATVEEVTGSGPSGYKVLTVSYAVGKRAFTVEDVVNERDDAGKGHWT